MGEEFRQDLAVWLFCFAWCWWRSVGGILLKGVGRAGRRSWLTPDLSSVVASEWLRAQNKCFLWTEQNRCSLNDRSLQLIYLCFIGKSSFSLHPDLWQGEDLGHTSQCVVQGSPRDWGSVDIHDQRFPPCGSVIFPLSCYCGSSDLFPLGFQSSKTGSLSFDFSV